MAKETKPGEAERGEPATFDPVSGEVHGSGSGSGANGNPAEDYDGDSTAGGGRDRVGGPRPHHKAVDRPIDPDEGI